MKQNTSKTSKVRKLSQNIKMRHKKPSFKNGSGPKQIKNPPNLKQKKPKSDSMAKEKKQKNYKSMSIDDFMEKELERSSDEEHEESDENPPEDDDSSSEIEGAMEMQMPTDGKLDSDTENDEDSNEFESHKESLAKLKEIDPEFYKFLQENDKKLLNFNDSDSDGGDHEAVDETEKLHKPTGDLEVASDESDFEPDDETSQGNDRVITLKLLKKWQSDIQTDKSANTIMCLTKAFHAALIRVSGEEEYSEYKVDGSAIFNAVMQLCVLEIGPALRRFLHISHTSKQPPHKCKRFVKIKSILRCYFVDLLKLLGGVTSTNILNVLLKHLHYMSPFMVSYTSVTKKMLKRIIHLWGTADETVRIVAFMCILRITNNQQSSYLDKVLKTMYLTYVKNCKFMSQPTLAEVNFMRRSLAEMFALDVNVSYQHVFLYIRQLAIHLRSAVTLHKKEHVQAVYNWQFVNSLHLWTTLLTITCNKPQLQPLVYPLVQVAIGTIKLLPTAQYFPLRFHCLQMLIDLSKDTNIFIPILPLLLEVLSIYDFNKKHKKVSMKPIQFTCLLRASKSQMIENGFKDTIIDNIYGLLLEYLAAQSHTISFPDATLFCVIQLKQFLKKCSVANYTKKFRQILEKIEQNTQFIENERKKITFNITDFKQIEAFETQIKNKGTPIVTYFESWQKLHNIKKRKQLTNNEAIGDYELPIIKKHKKTASASKDGQVELFPSDSEDDVVETEVEGKKKRGKRGSKVNRNKIAERESEEDDVEPDIVKDFKMSDL